MATTVFKTVKASGGDYTSLANLEAANANLVSLDQVWIVTCDNLEETANVQFNGWTTDSTRYLHVRAADAHASTGRVTTSSFRLVVNGTCLTVTGIGAGGLMIFEGLQFKSTSGAGRCVSCPNNGGITATVRFIGCVMEGAGEGFHADGGAANTNDSQWINCVAICAAACVVREYRDISLYSSTFITTGAGAHACNFGANDGRTKTVKSTYAKPGAGGNAYNSVYTGTAAASSDATGSSAPYRSIAYNTTNFTNVTATTEDLRLPSGSALLAIGADRSAEAAPFNYTTDIRGFPRELVSDDNGAYERALAPVAAFSGTPLEGVEPLEVVFTDASTNGPTSWLWDFGDGDTSTSQNPTHEYEDAGVYTVTLTATNVVGSDDEEKIDYVTVEAASSEDDELCSTDDWSLRR